MLYGAPAVIISYSTACLQARCLSIARYIPRLPLKRRIAVIYSQYLTIAITQVKLTCPISCTRTYYPYIIRLRSYWVGRVGYRLVINRLGNCKVFSITRYRLHYPVNTRTWRYISRCILPVNNTTAVIPLISSKALYSPEGYLSSSTRHLLTLTTRCVYCCCKRTCSYKFCTHTACCPTSVGNFQLCL